MRLVSLMFAVLVAGCGQEAPAKPPPSTNHLTGSGGAGGEGAGSGAGQGGAGQGGGADLDAGADAPAEVGPPEDPCTKDLAYWASGMTFTAPTPEPLGLALSELAYDATTHPISLVLKAKDGPETAVLAVSATQSDGIAPHVFPPGQAPTPVPALISFGSFKTGAAQAKGYLHLVDQTGPVDIELNDINVTATTMSNCSNVYVILSALIPVSMGPTVLHLNGGNSTIAELAEGNAGGEKDAGLTPWEIRAFFPGETISFDFSSL